MWVKKPANKNSFLYQHWLLVHKGSTGSPMVLLRKGWSEGVVAGTKLETQAAAL